MTDRASLKPFLRRSHQPDRQLEYSNKPGIEMQTRILNGLLLVVLLFVLSFPVAGLAQQVDVKNNSFYIDGKKFFVKGIGYEVGAIPGKLPWARTFDAELLRFDMRRILDGGFNTIRTWSPFTAQELDVIKQYDIKIIMGIWIDPGGNFADQAFVNQAKQIVTDVLSYSKNYNNIIAYLIMNEPQPENIARAGYDNTVALWAQLIDIIHAKHPNRPVSIANSCNGTYIDPDIFDFSAYNVYIYNPVTVNYLHGYRDYIQYLTQLKHTDAPLIVTEYGLSVSPTGPGNWGYGGNSLSEQQEGDLFMYKALVDGGAAGSCLFNYSDGWWKGGNEFVHDDQAEEWFGLVNYTGLSDKYGQVRPVWDAVKAYQSAIITQPRSSEIYLSKVPVEVFFNDPINRIEIMLDNRQVYQHQPIDGYLLDTLLIDVRDMKDALLVFYCYDSNNNLVKREEKSILIATHDLTLPAIRIRITNADFWKDGYADVQYQIDKSPVFNTGSNLYGIYYPHVGFDYGYQYVMPLPANQQIKITRHHDLASNVNVFTVGAAFDISYNNFSKRIVNQLTMSRINKIASGVPESLPELPDLHLYPNPAEQFVKIDNKKGLKIEEVAIYNQAGRKVLEVKPVNNTLDISNLQPGMYYCRIRADHRYTIEKFIRISPSDQ